MTDRARAMHRGALLALAPVYVLLADLIAGAPRELPPALPLSGAWRPWLIRTLPVLLAAVHLGAATALERGAGRALMRASLLLFTATQILALTDRPALALALLLTCAATVVWLGAAPRSERPDPTVQRGELRRAFATGTTRIAAVVGLLAGPFGLAGSPLGWIAAYTLVIGSAAATVWAGRRRWMFPTAGIAAALLVLIDPLRHPALGLMASLLPGGGGHPSGPA